MSEQASPAAAGAPTGADDEVLAPLLLENRALLTELLDQLERIDDAAWASRCAGFDDQTIGRHCRHVLEHYDALLRACEERGIAGDAPPVDYDSRRRCAELEATRSLALTRLDACRARLDALVGERADRPLDLRGAVQASTATEVRTRTSLGRELGFLASHTTHHAAIIALLMRGLGVEPTRAFGRAAATRRHDADGA